MAADSSSTGQCAVVQAIAAPAPALLVVYRAQHMPFFVELKLVVVLTTANLTDTFAPSASRGVCTKLISSGPSSTWHAFPNFSNVGRKAATTTQGEQWHNAALSRHCAVT